MRDRRRNLFGGAWEVVLSPPFRNASFALFIVGILAWGAAFAWYMLDRFDLVNLIRDVNFDDSFYYFQIAWHMSRGEFSTFDGGITRTNGYHPLWLFLITPFYWFFDKVEALFAIKAFELMLVAGGVALVAGAARVARQPWILLFTALPVLYRQRSLFVGAEAAAALFLLGLFLLAICLYARDPARWRWPLAAVAFALPWVRLEYVAIAMAATAALCLVEWLDRRPSALAGEKATPARSFPTPSPGVARPSVLALNAATPFFGALAGILVYFAYNGIVFGGIVPVSAAAKRFWSQSRWESEDGYSLTGNFHEFLRSEFFDDELLAAFEVCLYLLLVWWFSRRTRGGEDRLLLAFLVGVFGLAAGHLAKFVQSVLTVHPYFGNYGHYFVPAYLMTALVVPVRCYVAIWFIRRLIGPGPLRTSRIPSMVIVMLGAAFLFAKVDFAASFRSVESKGEAADLDRSIHRRMGAMVMNRLLPEGSVVGSWDSGVTGYFSRFPTVNLDGLVNSYEYLSAVKEGTSDQLHRRYGITHFANTRKLSFSPGSGTILFETSPYLLDGVRSQFKLWSPGWIRESWEGVDRSAWFRERLEPHLERQADGAGLLLDGRLAQAFAWDCTRDELAVWTRGADRRKAVLRPWTRTSIGFCTSALILPHDDLPPVRVATMAPGEYLERLADLRPAIRSDFDVYLVENRLVYVKEPCGEEDVAAPFFLHMVPVVPADLPGRRRRSGFDNLDFRFHDRSQRFGGTCLAEVLLPDYRIAAIHTGQYVAEEGGARRLWEGEIRPGADRGSARSPEGAPE